MDGGTDFNAIVDSITVSTSLVSWRVCFNDEVAVLFTTTTFTWDSSIGSGIKGGLVGIGSRVVAIVFFFRVFAWVESTTW